MNLKKKSFRSQSGSGVFWTLEWTVGHWTRYGPLQVYESSSGLRRGSLSEALPVSTEYLIALTVAHLVELEPDKAQNSFVLRVSNSVCEKVNVSDAATRFHCDCKRFAYFLTTQVL